MKARRMSAIFGGLLIAAALAVPAAAQAELCDAASGICIVNPPTAASPWIPPQLVELRLPSEAEPQYSVASWTQSGVSEYPNYLQTGHYPIKGRLELVQQGPPGGTSLYRGTLEPNFNQEGPGANTFAPVDGALTLSVDAARADPSCQCSKHQIATFTGLPVLSPVAAFSWHLVKRGQWFSAVLSLEARTPLRLSQELYGVGSASKERSVVFPLPYRKHVLTGSGPLRLVQKLSVQYVRNHCAKLRRCSLWASAWIGTAAESALEDSPLNPLSRSVPNHQRRPSLHRTLMRRRSWEAPQTLSIICLRCAAQLASRTTTVRGKARSRLTSNTSPAAWNRRSPSKS